MNHDTWMIGLEGERLTDRERRQLRTAPPKGVILFARNCQNKAQITALLDEVRQNTGQATWAAIDEEGGRVHRMTFPPFHPRPHAAEYGEQYTREADAALQAVYDDAYKVGLALADMGFTHNCAPILDIFHPQGHEIIGKRAYSDQKDAVVALASACVKGLQDAGIEAVGKHFPGHGRANGDSHLTVPSVDADRPTLLHEADIFRQVCEQGLHHIMSAHVIYTQVSDEIATFSSFWLKAVLREKFGFQGDIWSDDLCMRGAGDDVVQALRQAHQAGCDTLLVCEPASVKQCYASLSGID